MKTKAIAAASVVLVVLLFLAIPLIVYCKPPQDITVRHVKSVQTSNVTTMTFEIKNHTANTYIFRTFEVQVRNGNAWTYFQGPVDYQFGGPQGNELAPQVVPVLPTIGPTGLVHCTVNAWDLPTQSVVRFSISSSKHLLGLSGLFRRAELNWEHRGGRLGYLVPLNPYDKSPVLGRPTDVTSDEFVEQNAPK